jgi:Family of unknown function (DUF6544)
MSKVYIILCIVVVCFFLFYNSNKLLNLFKKEVKIALERTNLIETDMITENDLDHLPEVVKNYLIYVGVLGKPKVNNFRAEFTGRIRSNEADDWMILKSEQYNFIDNPTRLFYIEAKKMGIPAKGLHLYKKTKAFMSVKLLGLIKIVYADGPEMDQGETVTILNDMCIMAPSTLIDKNIHWEVIDSLQVKATLTNEHITISANLFFNKNGQLIDFVSYDRFETSDGKLFINSPWSTPIKDYKIFNGYNLPSFGAAIYKKDDGDFTYAEFNIQSIEYNCKDLK